MTKPERGRNLQMETSYSECAYKFIFSGSKFGLDEDPLSLRQSSYFLKV